MVNFIFNSDYSNRKYHGLLSRITVQFRFWLVHDIKVVIIKLSSQNKITYANY